VNTYDAEIFHMLTLHRLDRLRAEAAMDHLARTAQRTRRSRLREPWRVRSAERATLSAQRTSGACGGSLP
jgi:hypothetical protein